MAQEGVWNLAGLARVLDEGYDSQDERAGEGHDENHDHGHDEGPVEDHGEVHGEAHSSGHDSGHSYTDGLQRGYMDGLRRGYADGLEKGYISGLERGHDDGVDRGYEDGLEEGYEDGLERGYADGHARGCADGHNNYVRSHPNAPIQGSQPRTRQFIAWNGISENFHYSNGEYTDRERQWLQDMFRSEGHFLYECGLDLDNEAHRAEGRAIIRTMMEEDRYDNWLLWRQELWQRGVWPPPMVLPYIDGVPLMSGPNVQTREYEWQTPQGVKWMRILIEEV